MTHFYVRSTDGVDTDNGTTWVLAEATASAGVTDGTNADTIWLSQVHAEAISASGTTITCPTTPGMRVLCGNDGAEPPTALAATAVIASTFNGNLAVVGFGYFWGITFKSTGSSSSAIALGTSATLASHLVFENVQFWQNTASANVNIVLGPNAISKETRIDIIGVTGGLTTFRFADVAQSILLRCGRFNLTNVTIDGGGSAPTTLFKFIQGCPGVTVVKCSDLQGKTWTNLCDVSINAAHDLYLDSCRLPTSFGIGNTRIPALGTHAGPGGPRVFIERCQNGDIQDYFCYVSYEGSSELNTTIYRTAGGADDDGAHFSCKMISSANVKFWDPLRSPVFVVPITAVGALKTVTAYLAVDGTAPILTNVNVWMEIIAYTTSGVPIGVVATSRPTDVLTAGTNLTTSTEAFTGLGGTNAKFEIAVSFTPQEKGIYRAQICIAEAARTLFADFNPLVA